MLRDCELTVLLTGNVLHILHHSTVVCLVAWPLNEKAQLDPGLTASLSFKGQATKHPTVHVNIIYTIDMHIYTY